MRTLFPTLFCVLLALARVSGQDAKPTPAPADDKDVVRISTNLIQLDLTVTKDGQPVTDLKPEEIKILQNGKPQNVTHLSFVSVPAPERVSQKKNKNLDVAPTPVGLAKTLHPEDVRRSTVIVIDDHHLSWSSSFWVKVELKKFLEEQVFDGDLVSIVRTSSGIGSLQQFTSDRRVLLAAIDKLKFYPGGPGNWGPIDMPDSPDSRLSESYAEASSHATLASLLYVIAGLQRMPGRKSVVLITDGFVAMGSTDDQNLRTVVDYANRSSVVINTVAAAGVEIPAMQTADVAGVIRMGSAPYVKRIPNGGPLYPLKVLAEDTGGRRIVENNITHTVRKLMDDRSYYLVAYEPDSDTFDPKKLRYNSIVVKVSRPGVTVHHRRGFYGAGEKESESSLTRAVDPIVDALVSPFAKNEVFVRMNSVLSVDDKLHPMLTPLVNIRASDLTFEKSNGTFRTSFDVIAWTVDARGRVIDERPSNYTVTVDEKEYRNLQAHGVVSSFALPMAAPGGFQIRLAVRDKASQRIGSANQFVEIPEIKKDRLMASGLMLQSLGAVTTNNRTSDEMQRATRRDTALRQFVPGDLIGYSYQIINFPTAKNGSPRLLSRVRLFRDSTQVFDSDKQPVTDLSIEGPRIALTAGAVRLGKALPPGDYILQIDLMDSADKKPKVVTQFVQLEIIK